MQVNDVAYGASLFAGKELAKPQVESRTPTAAGPRQNAVAPEPPETSQSAAQRQGQVEQQDTRSEPTQPDTGDSPAQDRPSGAHHPAENRFAFDNDLARVFIEIRDADTGSLINELPPREIVEHITDLAQKANTDPPEPQVEETA
jgi:uncharacterized FlaG/YvyC family protein